VKQFDIYLVNLDPTIGSEIKKTRPAVIISPDAMNKVLNTVIIAPLISTQKGYPSRVFSNFKGKKGEVVLDQLRTVDKVRLIKKLDQIDSKTAQNIKLVLLTMFS
jgi:mRNA interferase MazF